MIGLLGRPHNLDNMMFFLKQFKCQRCGRCENIGGIALLPREVSRFADLSKKSVMEFQQDHMKGNLMMGCPFYKGGCTIYKDRAQVCIQYPFNQVVNGMMTVDMGCPASKSIADKYVTVLV